MGERTSYAPGTFSWTDLSTPDQDAAKQFYCQLFGWEATDTPIGEGIVYSLMSLSGRPVAAIAPQPQQQRDAGAPPAWNSYLTVESADETLDRARQLGATVHAPAFDVLDSGRMGVVQDPQGAFCLVWQPKAHVGAALVNASGALCWNELSVPDMDAAAGFYSELFGWSVEPLEGVEDLYMTITGAAGNGNGGIRPLNPPEAQPHWLVYFGVDDLERGLAHVRELGGSALLGPQAAGEGALGVAQDPQGAVFALYAGEFDD